MSLSKYLQQEQSTPSATQKQEPTKVTYGDFSSKVWEVEAPVINNDAPDVSGMLGKLSSITTHLGSVMHGNEEDRNTSMGWIKQEFQVQNKKQTVRLSADFVEAQATKAGVSLEDFDVKSLKLAVKTLDGNTQIANAQLDRLQADVNKLRQYQGFQDIEMQVVENGNQKIAVIVGADAKDMNSLLSAMKTRDQLQKAVHAALTPEKAPPAKDQTIAKLTGRVAELETKYPRDPSKAQTSEVALNDHNLQKPKETPAQQRSGENIMEVA